MAAAGLKARRPLQQAVGVISLNGSDQRPPQGERAGLVKDHLLQPSGCFDHIPAPKQPATPGGQSCGHGDHRGCGQTEGTGAGHHQHGNRQLQCQAHGGGGSTAEAGVVHAMARHRGMGHPGCRRLQHLRPMGRAKQPPEKEGGHSQTDDPVTETPGHPISQALNRSPACLRLLHQADDPCQRRLGSHTGDVEDQRCFQVEAAGGQLNTGFRLQGHRFTGEARDINGGFPLDNQAIHRDPVTGKQLQTLTGTERTDTNLADGTVRQHQAGGFRLQLSKLLQRQARAKAGTLLEETPQQDEAQQHHRFIEKAGPSDLRPDQGHDAGEIGTADPQSHQGVHAGGPGPSCRHTAAQDRATRSDQRHGCQSGVEGQAADERQGQVTSLAHVTKHREQQQHQGNHQLPPLLPPGQS